VLVAPSRPRTCRRSGRRRSRRKYSTPSTRTSRKQQLAGVEIVKSRGGSACFVTLGSTVGKLYEYYIPGTAKTLLVVCVPDDATADTIGPVDCAAAALGTKAG
jgi:hypothetical protein